MTKATAEKEKDKPLPEDKDRKITVTVLGQEGDSREVEINENAPCSQLLIKGLHALYGNPGPAHDLYDVVFSGTFVQPLSQKIHEVGIIDGVTVTILPKEISRGSR